MKQSRNTSLDKSGEKALKIQEHKHKHKHKHKNTCTQVHRAHKHHFTQMSNMEDALTCKRTIPPTEQTFSLLVSTQYGVQENPFSTEEGAPKANGVYYCKIPDGILFIYVPVTPAPRPSFAPLHFFSAISESRPPSD